MRTATITDECGAPKRLIVRAAGAPHNAWHHFHDALNILNRIFPFESCDRYAGSRIFEKYSENCVGRRLAASQNVPRTDSDEAHDFLYSDCV